MAAGGPVLEKLQRRSQAAAVSRAAGGPAFPPAEPPQAPQAFIQASEGAIIPFEQPPAAEQEDVAGLKTETAQQLALLRKSQRVARRQTADQVGTLRAGFLAWSDQKKKEWPREDLEFDDSSTVAPVPVGNLGDLHVNRAVCVPSVDMAVETFQKLALGARYCRKDEHKPFNKAVALGLESATRVPAGVRYCKTSQNLCSKPQSCFRPLFRCDSRRARRELLLSSSTFVTVRPCLLGVIWVRCGPDDSNSVSLRPSGAGAYRVVWHRRGVRAGTFRSRGREL